MIKIDDMTDYFAYLDELRESGETNMFGARPYLMREFDLEENKAARVLSAWMMSDLSLSPRDRAYNAGEQP